MSRPYNEDPRMKNKPYDAPNQDEMNAYNDGYDDDLYDDYDIDGNDDTDEIIDYDYDNEDEELFDELPPEEKKMRKIGRIKVAAGLFDFIAVIFGLVVALIMITLILSLFDWVMSDMGRTFNFLTT